jgi:hypothetical protein
VLCNPLIVDAARTYAERYSEKITMAQNFLIGHNNRPLRPTLLPIFLLILHVRITYSGPARFDRISAVRIRNGRLSAVLDRHAAKFHTFALARELYAHDALQAVFTGYSRFRLRDSGLPVSQALSIYESLTTGRR